MADKDDINDPNDTELIRKRTKVISMPDQLENRGCLLYVTLPGAMDQAISMRVDLGQVVIVGRDEQCDLVIRDSSVSRQHVRLEGTQEGITVQDLGSTNGTTYLGERIERATLKMGTQVVVGLCKIDLLPLQDSEDIPISNLETYCEMVGSSVPMRRMYSSLQMLEHSDAPVLIEGETGTGKELVARALHVKSVRAEKAFVVIDCGSVPAELMESELFGHRKGAFTGAVANHTGAFEAADGGTVFLDELGELPLELQPKLLRVLETGQVKRVGDVRYLPINVRIISATKRNLVKEVAAGHFREDLFYRVAVVQIRAPSLRERRDDIHLLVRHFVKSFSDGKMDRLPPDVEDAFMRHDWPGNVRELRNAVQRTLTLGRVSIQSNPLERMIAEDVPRSKRETVVLSGYRNARRQAVQNFETAYLKDLLARYQGNVSAAARAAGIDRKYLRDLLKKHGLYDG